MQATRTRRIWQGFATLSLWLLLMVGSSAAGENLPLKFQRYGLEQGLSQSVVTQIVQDARGFLWLGTQDGLNRFDGYGFRYYRHSHDQPDSLAANFISALLVDSHGRLWVGTELGLDRFVPEQGRFHHEKLLPVGQAGDEGLRVSALWEDRQGRLWVGTGNGLFLREESGTYMRQAFDAHDPESLSDNRINTLAEDGLGGLWIGTEEGLNRRDGASGKIQRFRRDPGDPSSLSDDRVLALHYTTNGQLWIGTVNGLNRFRPGQQDFLRYFSGTSPEAGLPSNRVQALSSDAKGRLWIGTERGLALRTEPGGGFQTLFREPQEPQGLAGDDITSFFTDRTGLQWLGTYGSGAAVWNPESARFSHYLSGRDGGPPRGSNRVESVSQDRLGRLWMGTADEGVFRLDRARRELKHFRSEPGKSGSLAHPRVSAIVEDRRGRMWFATHGGGLNRLDPGNERFQRWQHRSGDGQSLSDDRLLSLLEDRGGQLWIGGESGLDRYLDASEGFERLGDSLPVKFRNIDRRVNTILDTSDGRLWLGGDGGLLRRRENGGFDLYQSQAHEPSSLSHTAVLSLFEDAQSRLWIGTAAGLNRVDGQGDSIRFLGPGQAPILRNGVIYAIAGDKEGLLWLSTNQGLWRFSPESGRIDQFGLRDGLQADEFSTTSQYTAPDGELFFGGINGLSSFRPEAIVAGHTPPRVLFSELREYRSDGSHSRDLGGVSEIALPAAARTFTISYAAADFVHPGANRFQYRMNGTGGDWVNLDHQRELSFTDLSRGDYRLEVRASSRDGQWAEAGGVLNIRVAGPWWRSSWAWLGYFLVGTCLGLLGAMAWKQQRVQSRQRRQAEAKALQESLAQHEQELKALHLHIMSLEQHLQERIDENLALTSQLYELSMLDSLTELHNRRYISLNRDRLWPADVVRGHGLILLDIDGFIQLNRARGQAMGDRVLAQAATLLKNLCPEHACIARWGGDEFLILVANAGVEATETLAESLRVGFAQHEFLLGGEERTSLSCSLGACCHAFLPGAAEQGFEQALNLAERAMYAAKASSRNAWVLVGPGREAPARSLTGELSMTELLERGWIRAASSLPKGFAIRWLN
ncbi:MAG: diguanylate cyclase [Gammaproteobacteria bacterium]|nr:diguanylate cyclase [Gammaproteobacteria bacterium]